MRRFNGYEKLRQFGYLFLSLVLVIGTYLELPISRVFATGTLTSVSDTLETSAFSTASKQTIKFTTATNLTMASGTTGDFSVKVLYPTNASADPFTIPSLTTSDVSVACSSGGTACDGAASLSFTINSVTLNNEGGNAANDSVLLVVDGKNGAGTITAGATLTVVIGTGSTKITNPASSASGCTSNVCTLTIDTSQTLTNPVTVVDTQSDLVAFNSGVTVSATVNETLTFTIAQGAACSGDTGSPTSVNGSVTATAVPFGTVNGNTFYVGCQDLSVSTNGAGGYTVTSSENTNLKSASATYIPDSSCDSSCTISSGTAWATNTNNGLGFYCEGGIAGNNTCASAGNSTSKYRQFACTGVNGDCGGSGTETPQAVISAATTSAASGDTNRLHYKLSVAANQSAGTYSNTITHIATATF